MGEENKYIQTLDVLLEMENMDLLRMFGVSLLNRRETKEVDDDERDKINESLAEIVATVLLTVDNQYVDDIDDKTEELIDKITKLIEHGSNEEIVQSLFLVRKPKTESIDPTETTSWVAYG